MKKVNKIILTLLVFFTSFSVVNAECDYQEINKLKKEANKIKASFAENKEPADPDSYNPPDGLTEEGYENYVLYDYFFNVYLINLTENLSVEVKDKNSDKITKYTYSDTDNGTLILKQDCYVRNTYTFIIYADTQTCSETKLRTMELETPQYNEYSDSLHCKGNEEYYLCHKYVNFDLPVSSEFVEKLSKYISSKEKINIQQEKNDNEGFLYFIKDKRKTVIIVSIIIILVGVGSTVVIAIRRKRVI